MTSPASGDARRPRLVGRLLLAVAVVLLVSAVSWFGSGRAGVGIAQLVVGAVVAVAGGFLVLRGSRPR
jgi:hypothetical protein